MATQLGTAVNFAFASAQGITFTAPTFSGHFIQRATNSNPSDLAQVRNGLGDVVNETFYDLRGEGELQFIIGSATSIADAQTKSSVASWPPGTIVNISAAVARPDLVASNWVVTEAGARIEGENTAAASITIPIRKRTGITAVVT